MHFLGIDFGLKKIGTAVGAEESQIAFPRKVLKRDQSLFDALDVLIEKDQISQIIVGMPYKRDGSVGDIYDHLMVFVAELEERYSLPITLYDERYTTKLAEYRLQRGGMKAKDQKEVVDAISAQIILQEWMDEQ